MTPSPVPARLLAVGLALVVLADAPWAFTRGDVLRGVALPLVAALAALVGALAPARPGGTRRRFALLLLPAAVPLLALPGAADPTLVSFLRGASPWLAAAALGAGLWRAWREEVDVGAAWRWLVGAGALAGAWTVADALARSAPGVGPFGRPGIAGPVLGALLAGALLLPGPQGLCRLRIAALAAGCLATASRTGILAAALGTLAALALGATTAARRQRFGKALAAAVVLAGLALGLAAAGRLSVPGGGTTLDVRLGLWRATSTLVAERPLTGHGLGSFPAEVLRVRDPDEAALSRGRRPRVAHNDVLHAAAEGGVPAGLVLAAYLLLLLGIGVRAARSVASSATRALLASSVGALLALAVSAMGEDVLLDPAGALVTGVAAAALLRLAPGSGQAALRFAAPLLLVLGLVTLATAGVKARDLLADAHLRRYRDVIRGGVNPLVERRAAEDELVHGALARRADHPEALYRLGVHHAESGNYAQARETWREALDADPGMTEAWLDIARSYEDEGRFEDARNALREAARHDPTRYDVPLRLGHLALGKEPVPGERSGDDFDPIAAHRHYNEAERVAPGRFETAVARARIARRRADLKEAAAQLRRADEILPKAPETLLESFRLAEIEGKVADLGVASILGIAVGAQPSLAARMELEAESLIAEGRRREKRAREAVAGTRTAPDFTHADRAYDAAARRLAGLVHGRVLGPGVVLATATQEEEKKAWRPALTRLRAVLSWASTAPPELGTSRYELLRSLADAFARAAKAATRTDAPLARHFFARAHAAQGAVLLMEKEWQAAQKVLERAVEESPTDARVRVDLARALTGVGDLDGAEAMLLRALDLDETLRDEIRMRPAFEAIVARPAMAAALK